MPATSLCYIIGLLCSHQMVDISNMSFVDYFRSAFLAVMTLFFFNRVINPRKNVNTPTDRAFDFYSHYFLPPDARFNRLFSTTPMRRVNYCVNTS